MSDEIRCPSCNAANPVKNKFCAQCAAKLTGAAWADGPQAEADGFVQAGQWVRSPGEFVRRVPREDLKSGLFSAGMKVPAGSVGVLMLDGKVNELLGPGFRATETWTSRIGNLFTGKLDRTELCLIDLRPIPIPFVFEVADKGAKSKYQVVVELRVVREAEAIGNLLQTAVGERESLTARALYDQTRPAIEQLLGERLGGAGMSRADLGAAVKSVEAELRASIGRQLGMDLVVRASAIGTTVSFDVRVGGGASPTTKRCVGCACELESSKKFCTLCGAQQPVMTQPSRACGGCGALVPEGKKFCTSCGVPFVARAAESAAIFTRDGQDVELDLVLRAQGSADALDATAIRSAVAAAVAKLLRERDYAALSQPDGFASLETALRANLGAALTSLGLEIVELAVLDVRSKGHEWLLGARAEVDRAMKEAELGREWIAVEAQQLDVRAMTLDIVLRTAALERDHVFAGDIATLEDRRRRQELLDGGAALDVSDAQRNAATAIALDAARRGEQRTRVGEDHRDQLADAARGQEATVQAGGFARENELTQLRHERGRDLEAVDHQRAQEVVQGRHEMGLEREVAQHDAALTRDAMALDSERKRRQLDDATVTARTTAETDAFTMRTRGSAELDLSKGKQELELDAEARRQSLQVDKLRAMADLDARIREDELREQRQKQEHEQQLRAQLTGLTTEQMLAMQASGEGGAAMAAALTEKFKADAMAAAEKFKAEGAVATVSAVKQQELYERMLAEQKAAQAAAMQISQQTQAQMLQMMQTLGVVTTAAVGGQREAEAARQAAQAQAAHQAVATAERAMGSMAQVAASAAGASRVHERAGGGAAAAPVAPLAAKAALVCAKCANELGAADRVCGECGTRLG